MERCSPSRSGRLAAGRFRVARVPVPTGANHRRGLILRPPQHVAVTADVRAALARPEVTDENYVLRHGNAGVSDPDGRDRGVVPTSSVPVARGSPTQSSATPTSVLHRTGSGPGTSGGCPRFAYEFQRDVRGPVPRRSPDANRRSELPYLFDLPCTVAVPRPPPPAEWRPAASLRHPCGSMGALCRGGDPSTRRLPCPRFRRDGRVARWSPRSLNRRRVCGAHHCAFWATVMSAFTSSKGQSCDVTDHIDPTAVLTIDGLSIRYAESGASHGRHPATILAGKPRGLLPHLGFAGDPPPPQFFLARLIAIDLPGFGASAPRNLLSPRSMGAFLCHLIVEADLGRSCRVRTSGTSRCCSGRRPSPI